MKRAKQVWVLFSTAFCVSAVCNSGFAIMAMMKRRFVHVHGWFSEEEMDDYIALAQSAPGPMGVNASMIVGYQIAGFAGSLCAVLGCILPALLIMLLVSYFYDALTSQEYVRVFLRGMQMGVVAMLIDVLIGLFGGIVRRREPYLFVLIALAFLYVRFTNFSVLYLSLVCVGAGLAKSLLMARGEAT